MTDIERYRGDTAADQWTVQTVAGAAHDISGYTFTLTVSTIENPPTNSSELYNVSGTIIDGPGGVVEFTPTPVQTDQKPAVYYYDVQMVTAGTRIKTIDKGKYTYHQDITKT
jgi:hypothetical protein